MKTLFSLKKQGLIIVSILAIVFLSGCGVSSGLMNQFNVNGANTNVVLQKNNFKVLGTASGEADATYIFAVGLNKQTLVSQAKQRMIENAKLEGTSKAIINMSVEEHVTFILVYMKRTIKVHGIVIEFSE